MAKNLLAYGEYWEIISPYWTPENSDPLEPGPVSVGSNSGESGLTLLLAYVGPPIEEGDTLGFTATCTPGGEEWYTEPVYIHTYSDTYSEHGPVLHELTSTLLPGAAHKEVMVVLPASPDMTFFGWQYGAVPGAYSIEASGGPAPSAECFWTDLVNVTQECAEAPAELPHIYFRNSGISSAELWDAIPDWDGSGFSISIPDIEYSSFFEDQGYGMFYPTGDYFSCEGWPQEGVINYEDGIHGGVSQEVLVTNGCG